MASFHYHQIYVTLLRIGLPEDVTLTYPQMSDAFLVSVTD
jgi:hypothetical protein